MSWPVILLLFIILIVLLWLRTALRAKNRKAGLSGQVVVITGASRGIGKALALGLAPYDVQLVIAARSTAELLKVANACDQLSPERKTLPVTCDVSSEADRSQLIHETLSSFGRLDILINNAGIVQGGAFVDLPFESLERQWKVNVLAASRLTQLVLPGMISQGSGLIVYLSSVMGRFAMPNVIPYGVSKYALIGLSEGIRRELMGSGVSTLTVIGGFVDSGLLTAETLDAIRRSPMKVVSLERLTRRTIRAILLGRAQVYTHWFDIAIAYIGMTYPRLSDWLFGILAPSDMPDAASKQYTE
jgi:short-subunit dehydrogenase